MTSISISLDKYGDKSRVLLGFFLVSCLLLMSTRDYLSLEATTPRVIVGERLVSTTNPCFQFGILPYEYLVATQGYDYLSTKHALPIDPAVNGMSNCSTPLSSATVLPRVLQFHAKGPSELFNKNQNTQRKHIRYTFTDNRHDVVSAELLDTGELVLKNRNGAEPPVWKSFDYFRPTGTLLPGQHMLRNQSHSSHSWQKTGNPAIANRNVEELSRPLATKKNNKLVKILALAVGVPGALLVAVAILCLWRNEKVRQWLAQGLWFVLHEA